MKGLLPVIGKTSIERQAAMLNAFRHPKRPANDRHRLKALGNAVVPQVAEVVGRALMDLVDFG